MTEPLKSEKKQLTSLRTFIEDNQRLIAVLGVFVALALFWKVVLAQESAPYISYLCLLTTIPLIIEINRTYNYDNSSWNLVAFVSLLYGILAYTGYYLLVGYPNHLHGIVNGLIFAMLNYSLLAVINRFINLMKTNEYERNFSFQKRLEELGFPLERRNELMTETNADAKKFYRSIDRTQAVLTICGFVMSIFATALVSNYTRAIIDVIFDINPQINPLPLPS